MNNNSIFFFFLRSDFIFFFDQNFFFFFAVKKKKKMPVPSDIREAVRKEFHSRVEKLDAASVFDHRTNMMRARVAMLVQPKTTKRRCVVASSSSAAAAIAAQRDEVLSKSKFGATLQQRLDNVVVIPATLNSEASGIVSPNRKVPAAISETVRSQFVSRNAFDAAVAADARVEKKRPPAAVSSATTLSDVAPDSRVAHSPLPVVVDVPVEGLPDCESKQKPQPRRGSEFTRSDNNQQAQTRIENDKIVRGGDDIHGVDIVQSCKRHGAISPDDIKLQSTSGWVQRCIERTELEDNDAEFAHRMRLRERDERWRAPSPLDRYKNGSMRVPGADVALQVGAAGFFRPTTLMDSFVAKSGSSLSLSNQLQPATSDDLASTSACDDRRHRMQLQQSQVLASERKKLIGKAGLELLESSPRLMSNDWSFAQTDVRSGGQEQRERRKSQSAIAEPSPKKKVDSATKQTRNNKALSTMSSSSSSSSSDAENEEHDHNNHNHRNAKRQQRAVVAADAIELLESATVCACEMIAGGMKNPEFRNTDSTVVKNILKRALVVLVPKIHRTVGKAKRQSAASKDLGDTASNTLNQQMNLLRSWVKGCEVWIATELGLDTHAGFFSVVDVQHLREFCSLYARTKQIAERNTESLMLKWQQQRDILTDPAELVAVTSNSSSSTSAQQVASVTSSVKSGTLPAELSTFFKAVRTGRLTLGDSTLNGVARETTSKYYETLQRFGVLPMPASSDGVTSGGASANNKSASNRIVGSSLRLKQMLRRFTHVEQIGEVSSKGGASKLQLGNEECDPDSAATSMVNLFHPSWMRSVTGDATPRDEIAARVASIEAHDTVMVLELFIALLGESSQRYIRDEIDNAMKYFHDTAPDRHGQVALQEDAREKAALRSVHSQLLHAAAAESLVDHNRIAQLRRAIDKTDSWIHISLPEDSAGAHAGITAKHLSACSPTAASAAASMSGEIQNGDASGGADENASNRSMAEERARGHALQRLALLWKQLFVPFQYRMELLEKYRTSDAAKAIAAEQRYTECVNAVNRREACITAIQELDPARESAAQSSASDKVASLRQGGRNNNDDFAHFSSHHQQQKEQHQQMAAAEKQRQIRRQQLLSDFTAATEACDAAIQKLASLGEQLYYRGVIYSTKMKDDFTTVTRILRGTNNSASA